MVKKQLNDLPKNIIDDLEKYRGIPYFYSNDTQKLTEAIHILTLWSHYRPEGVTDQSGSEQWVLWQNGYDMLNGCLIELLSLRHVIFLNGSLVTYNKVMDKLNEHIEWSCDGTPSLGGLIFTIINYYRAAVTQDKRRASARCMKAYIWSGLLAAYGADDCAAERGVH